MEVDTVLSDFESSDFGEMVRKDGNIWPVLQVYLKLFLKKKKKNSVKLKLNLSISQLHYITVTLL